MNTPRAYLEYQNDLPLDDFVYISQYPLQERGFTIIKGNNETFEIFETSIKDVAIGSVEFCIKFFKSLNITPPQYIGYPESIKSFLHRNVFITSLKEMRQKSFPIFIKPYRDVKLFTGIVIESQKDIDLLKLYADSLTEDTKLWASETINIDSEYRVFVHTKPDNLIIKDKIVGIKHYFGNYKIFPDDKVINLIYEIIEAYSDSPICYSLDIGLEKRTNDLIMHLIEINDVWALGSYGLHGKLYTKLVIDRFNEIKNSKQ